MPTDMMDRTTPPKRVRRNRFGGSDPETMRQAMHQVRIGVKERHAKLIASGAPSHLDALNGQWRRSEYEPFVDELPHYVKEMDDFRQLHLFFEAGAWQIASSVGGSDVLARAASTAQHPNTVDKGSWSLPMTMSAHERPTLVPFEAFDFWTDGPNTPEQPFQMEELGLDYFIRPQPRKQVIWFEDPNTGQVFHSGAKKAGVHSDKPGNRYCPMCKRCFSANNFKFQHMRTHARSFDSLPTSLEPTRSPPDSLQSTPMHSPISSPLPSPTSDLDAPTGCTGAWADEEMFDEVGAFSAKVGAFSTMLPPAIALCKSFDPIEELMKVSF